jgi:hypothetical protein
MRRSTVHKCHGTDSKALCSTRATVNAITALNTPKVSLCASQGMYDLDNMDDGKIKNANIWSLGLDLSVVTILTYLLL